MPQKPKPLPRTKQFARAMRASMTEAEKRLWWALRHRLALKDTHFRRQVRIGPYIADFCCLSASLIVEADGGQHYTDGAEAGDARRTGYLEKHGFRVLRFSNATILQDMDCVIDTIVAHLPERFLECAEGTAGPHPARLRVAPAIHPPRKRGG
ncbi:MAG: endonuclease domain-containing protein [Beijerinckiaceae bacterium]